MFVQRSAVWLLHWSHAETWCSVTMLAIATYVFPVACRIPSNIGQMTVEPAFFCFAARTPHAAYVW